jgi:hypothetical protein
VQSGSFGRFAQGPYGRVRCYFTNGHDQYGEDERRSDFVNGRHGNVFLLVGRRRQDPANESVQEIVHGLFVWLFVCVVLDVFFCPMGVYFMVMKATFRSAYNEVKSDLDQVRPYFNVRHRVPAGLKNTQKRVETRTPSTAAIFTVYSMHTTSRPVTYLCLTGT